MAYVTVKRSNEGVEDSASEANFNETALMRKHHENYIQVKTFIKNAQKKFLDNTPARVDHHLETTRNIQTTDVRNWLWGNSSSVDPGNDHLPYLPFGRSRPTFPDEITPFTTQINDNQLKWDEIFPNQKSKTNVSSFGIDSEISSNANLQLSSVSLMNSKDRKGFKPGVFEIRLNPENVSTSPKKENFILKLSDPIESRLHIDYTESSTVEIPTNLNLSSKIPKVDPEYQKRFHPNESRSRFVNPEFSLRRPMSDFKSPSKKYTVDPYYHNHVEAKSETGEYRERGTTVEISRSRNPSTPPFKISTSSIKYQYRFDPSLQTKQFILRVKPVPVTAKSSSSSPKTLKPYPKTKNSFDITLKPKEIILRHSSKKTTKAKMSSKTLKPSPKTLQSSGPKMKSSIVKILKSSSAKTFKSLSAKILKSFKSKTIKSYRPKILRTSTKALKSSSAKNLKFTNANILKPSPPKKIQSMKPHNYSPTPRAKPTAPPKPSLNGHSGKGFEFNTSLRRPNEVYEKKWFREVTTYMSVENWVLTLAAKIGLTTRHDFAANPTPNIGRPSTKPHALVSNKQIKNTLKNQAINILRQGPPRTRTNIEDHLSITTAEYEDYSLPTTPTNVEEHRLSTTTIKYEDYSLPTKPTNIEDYRLLTTTTEVEDYYIPPTTPADVRDHRLSTTTAEYEDYSLPHKPINIEDITLSTTTKEVEDYSLPTTSTKVEDHTLTTATNKPRFTIENHGGILHLITIPDDDEDTPRVGRPGFIVEDEEMLEPLTTIDVMNRGPVMISTRDGMYGAQNLAAQKIDKTRRHLLKEKKIKGHPHHKHNTRKKKHKHGHQKNRKKQKKQAIEDPLLFPDLRKRLSIGTPMELPKENRSISDKQKNGETYPLKALPELSHNDTVIEKVFKLMETQDKTPEIDNKTFYNKVKETLKQAQIRKEVERQKKKAELIRRIAEGSSYSDEEESLKRNLVQALQYGNRTSEYDLPLAVKTVN